MLTAFGRAMDRCYAGSAPPADPLTQRALGLLRDEDTWRFQRLWAELVHILTPPPHEVIVIDD